uniref:Insulin receptor substrate 2 n=1 Tax=Ornithorhynchus anatinus TaxID=9258 RepID=A0A6I8NRK4_ORNAN
MASPAAAAAAAAAAAGCNLNNNNNHPSGVRKCGYLRKQKHGHKRFFVLRGPGPPAQPARLEYYDSEKKWRSKAAAPKRVISLDSCLNVNKRADAKHKYLIALYTRDEYFAVAADDEREQDGWYRALTDLLSEGKAGPEASSGCSPAPAVEEPPAGAAYREVWQVNLKPKGLGHTKNLTGVYRLCLAARTVGLVKLNRQLPSVTLQLMSIRRCGHSDSFFFMEVGRSAATGPGELWMQADDSVVAQNIHETILEAMKALKELAEFRPPRGTAPPAAPGPRSDARTPAAAGDPRPARPRGCCRLPPPARAAPPACRRRRRAAGRAGGPSRRAPVSPRGAAAPRRPARPATRASCRWTRTGRTATPPPMSAWSAGAAPPDAPAPPRWTSRAAAPTPRTTAGWRSAAGPTTPATWP